MVRTPSKKEEAIVSRDNRLVRSCYWMTVPEKRMLYWIFWTYQREGTSDFLVSISELAKFCDIKGKGVMRTWYLIGRRPEPRLSDSDLAAPEHPNVQAPAG